MTPSHAMDTVKVENLEGLRFIKLGYKQHWHSIIQSRMQREMIIVFPAGFDHFWSVFK